MKNSMYVYTLRFSLGLCVALIFWTFGKNVHASTVWTQNFDSLASGGTICTNPYWTFYNYCATLISSTTCYQGTKCGYQEYNSGTTYYTYPVLASSTEGTLEMWVKLENDVSTAMTESIQLKAGAYVISLLTYAKSAGTGNTKTLTVYDHNGNYPITFPNQGSQWLGIRIMFNINYDRVYYAFKTPTLDWTWSDNDYAMYHQNLHGNHFSEMEISKSNSNYNSFYFDDFSFTDIYSNPHFEDVDIITPDFTLRSDIADFTTVQSQTCFTGSDCTLNFSFNDLAIGDVIYLGPGTSWGGEELGALSSTTIAYTPLYQGSLIVPAEVTEQKIEYCVYLDDPENDKLRCGIEISWINESTLENWMNNQTAGYCDTICDDIATTSDFLYGVQCGFQSAMCFLFYPSAHSIVTFTHSVEDLESTFPFRLVFVLPTAIESAIDQASTTGVSIEIPMMPDYNNPNELEFLTIASSTTMDSVLGTSTVESTRLQIRYVIWIVTILICIMITLFLFVL